MRRAMLLLAALALAGYFCAYAPPTEEDYPMVQRRDPVGDMVFRAGVKENIFINLGSHNMAMEAGVGNWAESVFAFELPAPGPRERLALLITYQAHNQSGTGTEIATRFTQYTADDLEVIEPKSAHALNDDYQTFTDIYYLPAGVGIRGAFQTWGTNSGGNMARHRRVTQYARVVGLDEHLE